MFDWDKYWLNIARAAEGCVMVTQNRILATGKTVPIQDGAMIRRKLNPMEEHATWDCFLNVLKHNINPHHGMAITMYYWRIPPSIQAIKCLKEDVNPWFIKVLWNESTPIEWRNTEAELKESCSKCNICIKFYEPDEDKG